MLWTEKLKKYSHKQPLYRTISEPGSAFRVWCTFASSIWDTIHETTKPFLSSLSTVGSDWRLQVNYDYYENFEDHNRLVLHNGAQLVPGKVRVLNLDLFSIYLPLDIYIIILQAFGLPKPSLFCNYKLMLLLCHLRVNWIQNVTVGIVTRYSVPCLLLIGSC